ncbi:MAG: PA0069 family radical SAM protein [Alphaproteobacteria bacterium]|nr:PA0069 family radical SAM protein [Alphaproteobacteria bacterium]
MRSTTTVRQSADKDYAGVGHPPYDVLPARKRKSRGAISNREGRFERLHSEHIDDGWTNADDLAADPPRLDTQVLRDTSRTVIARNQSPDIGFDRSINPYRGCEHGCIYCFARPTHAWLGLSPGLDFETKLFAKPDAAEILRRELASPRYQPRTIAMGTNTDPYQPIERRLQITRQILEVLAEHDHPVSIVTKSHLVCRDIDILGPMAAKGLASVSVSVTTLDQKLARAMEPRAAPPERRLATLTELARADIPTGVMVAPVIPALTDHELEAILIRARQAGAKRAGYIVLRLPLELKELFQEWLAEHVPDREQRVLKRLREFRGGELYRSEFGSRMRGNGRHAELLATRFRLACRQNGLNIDTNSVDSRRLDSGQFRVPPQAKTQNEQLQLFSN